jgi:hypothetical protein
MDVMRGFIASQLDPFNPAVMIQIRGIGAITLPTCRRAKDAIEVRAILEEMRISLAGREAKVWSAIQN